MSSAGWKSGIQVPQRIKKWPQCILVAYLGHRQTGIRFQEQSTVTPSYCFGYLMWDYTFILTNCKGYRWGRCSKAGEQKRSGTLAAIHTAALTDDPEGAHRRFRNLTAKKRTWNQTMCISVSTCLKKDLSLDVFIHIQKRREEANPNC